MKNITRIELYFSMIEGIKYENPHGGAYAYVQFLAYARELVKLLQPLKKVDKQIDTIEGVSWLFNEYLCTTFTPRQQAIFENKKRELKDTFNSIRLTLKQPELDLPLGGKVLHRQAA